MKILGFTYKLVSEDDHADAMGRCDIGKQIIRIKPNQSQEYKEATVLHEIIEALNYHLQLGFGNDTNKVVMPLESALYQVLTNAGVDLSPLTNELYKMTKKHGAS